MAKSTEQKIIDDFYNSSNSRFDEYTFARQMGSQDWHTQQAFWKSVMAYIIYKAAIADYTPSESDSIALMCQKMRNSINSSAVNF